jgi:hypothetical protein
MMPSIQSNFAEVAPKAIIIITKYGSAGSTAWLTEYLTRWSPPTTTWPR